MCGDKMRVVSGRYKGRPLKAVPGTTTRPTTDKVKEAIFNIIGPYFEDGIALDLFGGSGGLGIEALSRGLSNVIFVDKDAKAIQTIKTNVSLCNLHSQVEIYRNDAERALKAIIKRDLQFDMIFLDPPYKTQKLQSLIETIHNHQLIKDMGYIIAEHGVEVVLPEQIGNLTQIKYEKYGITAITIFQYQK